MEKFAVFGIPSFFKRTACFRTALGAITLFLMIAAPLGSLTARSKQGIFLTDAWVQISPIPGRPAAAYLVIENRHIWSDFLVAVESPAAKRISLHRTRSTGNVSTMEKIDHLEIPARSTTALAPGKIHLMLMKTADDLASRKTIRIHLRFEKAGWIEVEATVRLMGSRETTD
ncbi:MAG: copper chaperone PCu(A)C [Proteobacteria bacterium]|nr:copper chaperone PCu(A)C [Pseudomonadota bacterium]